MRKLSLLFLALFCITCKKYPEDDKFLELTSAKSRLTKGGWTVTEYLVNGVDSTESLPSCISGTTPSRGPYFFRKPDDSGETKLSGPCTSFYCYWKLVQKKKVLNVFNAASKSVFTPVSDNTDWEIRKLTKEDMKLKAKIDGKEYQISLKKD